MVSPRRSPVSPSPPFLVHPFFPRRLAAGPPPSHPLHFALDGCITIDSSTTLVTGALPYYDSKGKQAHTRDEEEEARRRWQGAGEGEGCGGEEEGEDGEEVCVRLLRVLYESEV